MKNATFRQLRVFNEVARHLSFVRAAENLHLTPPAVTMQVKELEGHVGMPLFDRKGKQVSLTTTGEYMLVYARKILATVKDAEDAAARLQRAETGVLTIGFVSTAKYFLMRLLAEFRTLHPGVDIQISIGNRDQLVGMLQNSEVDIAVMGRPPKELQTRAEPFAAHPHVFVSAVDHPLAHRDHLRVEDLRPFDFIVREKGAGTRAAMEKFFEDTHVEPRLKLQLHSNEIIKQAVMAGLGLGFLSLHTIGLELEHNLIRMLDVEGAPVVRSWNVVHTQSKMLSPAAEAFRYFMLEEAESHLAQRFGMHWPKA
ncbi:MAG: LysR substrate-binding domain-containing protein [Limnohabitans sp.]|jgi:LysR family transcriptional regulator, low CO2-responsive transcriptional regulator|nr:LysR substrate-binding domain-containing protein [Limnohabitans sp.]MDP4924083.1 LysR substrate-binding domain-containing protein [Limnohabitans sp.]